MHHRHAAITKVVFPLLAALVVVSRATAQVDFDAPKYFGTLDYADDMVVGDFDGDGNLDVVVGYQRELVQNSISVFLGDATGGFAPRRDIALPFAPYEFVGGDFNGDHRSDLAITEGEQPQVAILLADGLGGFLAPMNISVAGFPEALVVGDVNRDGRLDLVVSLNSATDARVLFGDGHGGFSLGPSSDIVAGASACALADFDRDGFLDLALTHSALNDVRVLRGDGLGHFTPQATLATPLHPISVITPDLDGDGFPDLVVGTNETAMVSVFLSDGAGGFGLRSDHSNDRPASGLAAADFDEDGNVDIASTRSFFSATVYFGDGMGGLGPRIDLAGLAGKRIAAVDVDRDGHQDLLTCGENCQCPAASVIVRLGDGAGSFHGRRASFVGTLADRVSSVTSGRVNSDAHLDLVALNPTAGLLLFFAGDGTGSFASPATTSIDPNSVRVVLGDFDGDADLDAAIVQGSRCTSPVAVALYFGDGTGTFVPGPVTPLDFCPRAFAVGDVDEDGLADIVVSPSTVEDGQLRWLKSDGAGAFSTHVLFPSGVKSATQLLLHDVDGDGHLDVLFETEPPRGLTLLFGDGNGGVAATDFVRSDYLFTSFAVGDLDRDGNVDVAASALCCGVGGGAPLLLFFGDGPRSVADTVRLYRTALVNANGLADISMVDVDEDGRLDVVAGDIVLHGDGDGGFSKESEFDVGLVASVAVDDVDEDGHLDSLVIANDLARNLNAVSLLNRTPFDLYRCRAGNVNAGSAPTANVLFINGRRGFGPARYLDVDRNAAFTLRLQLPPAASSMTYALYAWNDRPTSASSRTLPDGIGESCMVTPLSSPLPSQRPKAIWNTIGDFARFGAPTRPSPPAPGPIFSRPQGLRKHLTFFVQGIVTDPAAPNGELAVTNGILVRSL
ncbi:MAG: VCBS repeat-containing protein [Planctomycetes bacterium]|nr:VCBS repeat-containing protein [Planctomycetota bacterium]